MPVDVVEGEIHGLGPGDDETMHALVDLLVGREEEEGRELRPAQRVPA